MSTELRDLVVEMKSLLERLETQAQFQHEYMRVNGVVKAGSNHRTGDQMRSWLSRAQKALAVPVVPASARIPTVPTVPLSHCPTVPPTPSSLTKQPVGRKQGKTVPTVPLSQDNIKTWAIAYNSGKSFRQIEGDETLNPARVSKSTIQRKVVEYLDQHPEGVTA